MISKRISKLSLAVLLKDKDNSQGNLKHEVRVKLKETAKQPVKHPGGHYLFMNLTQGKYTIITQSNYYLKKELIIDTRKLNHKMPVVEVVLQPKPYNTLAAANIIIKGKILDHNHKPISGAKVKPEKQLQFVYSNDNGEFTLRLEDFEENEIHLYISKKGYKRRRPRLKINQGQITETSIVLKE